MTDSGLFKAAIQVSKALLWLFTTQAGILCLGGGAAVLLFARFATALRERALLLKAAGKKMGVGAACSVMAGETLSLGALAAANVPTLVCLAALLSVCLALSGTAAKLDEFLGYQRKIKEYGIVLENLERRYKVARVECLGQEEGKSLIAVSYFDQDGNLLPDASQKCELPGKDIFLDALVLNFAYTGIESGKARNLALPFRLFSESLAQSDGVALALSDPNGQPYVYRRTDAQLYGMEKADFDDRLKELLDLAKDGEKARKAGIVRSLYGNAVHRIMKKGDAFTVWVEQSGGLSAKEDAAF